MSYNTARPYMACFVLIRKNDRIAFLLRSGTDWMNGYYGLPAGKVEINESLISGTIREAKEEIGVNIEEADLQLVHVTHRKSNDDTLAWMDMYFETNKWTGKPFNAEPHKHSELAWLDPNNLPKNIVPTVRFSLEQIKHGKPFSQYGWDET